MLQGFAAATRPEDGPPRLARLRERLAERGLDGFLVPRADAHQGEYVAPHDERLQWLTGFTGSAGFCAVLRHAAGLFVDGRYTLQAAAQVDTAHFAPVNWPATQLADWLAAQLPNGGVIGFDPWLHTAEQIDQLRAKGEDHLITYSPCENLVDSIWPDQPLPPQAPARPHPIDLAGVAHGEKRAQLAAELRGAGVEAAVLTLPDSIAWLLNIRGGDVSRVPVAHGFALLHATGAVTLFLDPAKADADLRAHLGNEVRLADPADFGAALAALTGPVRFDPASTPVWARDRLARPKPGKDPCQLPKARKNPQELKGMEAAHARDAAAVARFLCWLDGAVAGGITEIDAVRRLEAFRAEAPELRDLSFDTIAGSGPNGAIVHYRVTEATNRRVVPGDLFLIDSGAQYTDGTTDITRTVATGPATPEQKACFTRVLKGMIAISQARWPRGLAGRDIEALARAALWQAGQDYDHGTGHGVGACLSVHEGPQSLSRRSEVALEPGMILSNEPGYYRAGGFGIRIENLVHVVETEPIPGGDPGRRFLGFATLTWAPVDRRLIDAGLLSEGERAWLDGYHAEVRARVTPWVDAATAAWLAAATAPLD
jgi:Xaa-Pro aminopeptidase